jgi:hypothetical protein
VAFSSLLRTATRRTRFDREEPTIYIYKEATKRQSDETEELSQILVESDEVIKLLFRLILVYREKATALTDKAA